MMSNYKRIVEDEIEEKNVENFVNQEDSIMRNLIGELKK